MYELNKALRKLADYYGDLERGRIQPHNDKDIANIRPIVSLVIRELVNNWV